MNQESDETFEDAFELELRSRSLAGQPRSRDTLMYQCGWAAASADTEKSVTSARRWNRVLAFSTVAVTTLALLNIVASSRGFEERRAENLSLPPHLSEGSFSMITNESKAALDANSLFYLSQQFAMGATPRMESGKATTTDRPDEELTPILRVTDFGKVLWDSQSL